MRLINRQQFAKIFNDQRPGLGDKDSVLWIPEESIGEKCRWFIRTHRPITFDDELATSEFWSWCSSHLDGLARCFSSSETEEWWGFTNKDDIVIFSLKWC